MSSLKCGYVFSFGSPLLDISARADNKILKKFSLEADNVVLAQEHHLPIFDELIKNYPVTFNIGGAALNSIRMIQWLVNIPELCSYVGCIGADEWGKKIENECNKLKLKTIFEIKNKPFSTGKVAVLITENCRSMVTHLGASSALSSEFMDSSEVWNLIETAQVFYATGYTINICYTALLKIAAYSQMANKLFCFNLSAPYLCKHNIKEINKLIFYSNIVFANENEALEYGESHNLFNYTTGQIAQYLAKQPCANNHNKNGIEGRLVIITQSIKPVIVVHSSDLTVHEYPVKKLPNNQIVDTNGAGDAFVAGFIAEYILTISIEKSLKSALKAAAYIIQQCGFDLSARQSY